MRLRFVAIPALVALAGAACAAGCSLLTGYDGFTGGGGGTGANDGGAGRDDSGRPPDAAMAPIDAALTPEQTLCAADIPPKPSGTNVDSLDTYVGVVTAFRFSPASGGCPTLGKNIDGLYTCADGGAGPVACLLAFSDGGACDGPGGVDNNAQMGLESFLSPSSLLSLPQDLVAQRTGFVVTLGSYGGGDDPAVNVGVQIDVGRADGGTLVDESSVVAGHVIVQASQAYVTNGVLVARFETQQVPLHFTQTIPDSGSSFAGVHGVTIPLSHATLIGIPVLGDGGLTMNDAQLVGRVGVVDLANALSSLVACITSSIAPMDVCPNLDLPEDPADDGKAVYCEAISFGMGFDLVPTAVVGTGPVLPPIDHCGTGTAPVTDMICAPPSSTPPDDAGPSADAGDAGDDAQGSVR